MTALVKLNTFNTSLSSWSSYPDDPDNPFKFWMAQKLLPDKVGLWTVPGWYQPEFCNIQLPGGEKSTGAIFLDHSPCGMKFSESWNFMVCEYCHKPRVYQWPLFIFECDECEFIFMVKRWPIHYHLCSSCGGT